MSHNLTVMSSDPLATLITQSSGNDPGLTSFIDRAAATTHLSAAALGSGDNTQDLELKDEPV
jgi:hypothetical protein